MSEKVCGRGLPGGHKADLLNWANTIGLTSTTHLAGTGVVTVATAVSRHHVREGSAVTDFVACSHRRRSLVPNFFGSARMPATAREAISTTSSMGRRPCGKPAKSPARKPRRFWLPTGVGEYRYSAAVDQQSVRRLSDRSLDKWEPCTGPEEGDRCAAPGERECPVSRTVSQERVEEEAGKLLVILLDRPR